ncbi:hypothetical protein N7535_005909, partial [Penicillium sp. DV-2018c]
MDEYPDHWKTSAMGVPFWDEFAESDGVLMDHDNTLVPTPHAQALRAGNAAAVSADKEKRILQSPPSGQRTRQPNAQGSVNPTGAEVGELRSPGKTADSSPSKSPRRPFHLPSLSSLSLTIRRRAAFMKAAPATVRPPATGTSGRQEIFRTTKKGSRPSILAPEVFAQPRSPHISEVPTLCVPPAPSVITSQLRHPYINLTSYFIDGGSWDNMPREAPVLNISLFLDARRGPMQSSFNEKSDVTDSESNIGGGMSAAEGDDSDKSLTSFTLRGFSLTRWFDDKESDVTDSESVNTDLPAVKKNLPWGRAAGSAEHIPYSLSAIREDDSDTPSVTSFKERHSRVSNIPRPEFEYLGPSTGSTKLDALVRKAIDNYLKTVGHEPAAREPIMDTKHPYEVTMLPTIQLQPLVEFRNLRELRLTGMAQSYQPFIWQAAWANPGLAIDKGWQMNTMMWAEPTYHGDIGEGALARKYGEGEYLDKRSIEWAKVLVSREQRIPVKQHLSVKVLTLSGFVLDGDAFAMWFRDLEQVHFKKNCVDCGFWLGPSQRGVRVFHSEGVEVEIARVEDMSSED